MPKYILALDQGTTSSRAIVFGHDGRAVATAQQEFPQILPAPGPRRARSRGDLVLAARRRPRGAGRGHAHGRRHRRHRRHQPARDDDPLGPRHRPAGGQRHRLAEPRQRADLRPAEGRRAGSRRFARKTGPGRRRLFLRHEDQAPARHASTGLRARAERGEILFGTVDTLLIWRLTGGTRARDRLQQRQPHAALQHPHARLGRRAAARSSTSRARCCPRCGRRAKSTARPPPTWFGGPIPIAGDAGDQQAATFGQACFQPGSGQEHLRHRLLHAA